ncbi:SufE protein probably involved in Fe-S center assembly [Hoeflea phototrophica DFL-43]|uniref:SufE protein probably involved in Fe-S center assembly n=1 Tax=Hoeflea phototrophica (strain DSM 17068 / NCIMB 14078 / DFL-43) TaxID=411684 RepID=A9D3T6_HOEPD|nr:SufE family protein [Hoeflea phototrophica]EDQ33740.1 SufE protein probably involved in Fe-S center assembly [Hoeflea phototrophica DFL-43]
MSKLQTIIDDFEYLDDWEDRYRYLIEIGKALPDMPEKDRTEDNKVKGCASQVWLVAETKPGESGDPVMVFRGDSDAHIVRGLVGIVLAATSDHKASQVEQFDEAALLAKLGLGEHLTPQRANGLRSMVMRIKAHAAAARAG